MGPVKTWRTVSTPDPFIFSGLVKCYPMFLELCTLCSEYRARDSKVSIGRVLLNIHSAKGQRTLPLMSRKDQNSDGGSTIGEALCLRPHFS